MSKIIKKITKKYKWLRFLNYKTTKLAVLSAALFGLCLSSGHSFAKYRDENYGGGNAGTANFGDASLKYDYEMNQSPAFDTVEEAIDFYAFIASFRIEFSESEVARTFSLDLRMSVTPFDDYKEYNPSLHTTFVLPTNMQKTIVNGEGKLAKENEDYKFPTFITKIENHVGYAYKIEDALNVPSSITANVDGETKNVTLNESETNRQRWDLLKNSLSISQFSPNTLYYSYADEDDVVYTTVDGVQTIDKINYTWETGSYNFDGGTTNTTTEIVGFINKGHMLHDTKDAAGKYTSIALPLSLEKKTYYFQILFFSEIYTNENMLTISSESTKILSHLSVEQVVS